MKNIFVIFVISVKGDLMKPTLLFSTLVTFSLDYDPFLFTIHTAV